MIASDGRPSRAVILAEGDRIALGSRLRVTGSPSHSEAATEPIELAVTRFDHVEVSASIVDDEEEMESEVGVLHPGQMTGAWMRGTVRGLKSGWWSGPLSWECQIDVDLGAETPIRGRLCVEHRRARATIAIRATMIDDQWWEIDGQVRGRGRGWARPAIAPALWVAIIATRRPLRRLLASIPTKSVDVVSKFESEVAGRSAADFVSDTVLSLVRDGLVESDAEVVAFAVMREDIHGNRVEIARYVSRDEAESVVRNFEDGYPHRQYYFVVPVGSTPM